jgi:hypothetical protein
MPKAFPKSLNDLTEKISAQPDQTATLDEQMFLTAAQLRCLRRREPPVLPPELASTGAPTQFTSAV